MYKSTPSVSIYCAIITTTCLLAIFIFMFLAFNYFNFKEANKDYQLASNHSKIEAPTTQRLVCYYTNPASNATANVLRLEQIDGELCTHINLGMSSVGDNFSLVLSENFQNQLRVDLPILRKKNEQLKLLLWIGGGGSSNNLAFSKMIAKHATRKIFIRSIKEVLHTYKLDGIDLDWEFPSAYNKERMHFSKLLYELRQEFKREKKNYFISIAVAAVEGIAVFAYDVREINLYADYVNLMSYDYHFFSKWTPFTGLNAPLYARENELSILSTLNINYSVNWWLSNGLQREKLVIGLPTYGHSFTLVNAFNNGLQAPAEGFGSCGQLGYVTYSELCWFMMHNVGIKIEFDMQTASPYLSSANEWISYENEKSIELKTKYIRSLNVGGVMAFSLNTDDVSGYCLNDMTDDSISKEPKFPLINTIKANLLF